MVIRRIGLMLNTDLCVHSATFLNWLVVKLIAAQKALLKKANGNIAIMQAMDRAALIREQHGE